MLQVTFWLNGRSLGVAFTDIRTFEPHLAYFPALSLSEGEASYVNLGGQSLRYPVEGYKPFMAPPAPGRLLACDWLLSKFKQLCVVRSSPLPGKTALLALCFALEHVGWLTICNTGTVVPRWVVVSTDIRAHREVCEYAVVCHNCFYGTGYQAV